VLLSNDGFSVSVIIWYDFMTKIYSYKVANNQRETVQTMAKKLCNFAD